MLSKLVTDYLKSARELSAILRAQRGAISNKLSETLQPVLAKGESLPDGGFLLELFARHVDRAAAELEAADAAHNEELSDDAGPRKQRDEAAEGLRGIVVDIKQAMQALYGPEALGEYRIPEEVPHDPAAVQRMGADVSEALETKALPKPVMEGVKVDAGPWVAKMKKPLKALEGAISDVAREAGEAQATQVKKNQALAAFEKAFGMGAAGGRGLLSAAGEEEHAKRISLSPKRGTGGGRKGESGGEGTEGGG